MTWLTISSIEASADNAAPRVTPPTGLGLRLRLRAAVESDARLCPVSLELSPAVEGCGEVDRLRLALRFRPSRSASALSLRKPGVLPGRPRARLGALCDGPSPSEALSLPESRGLDAIPSEHSCAARQTRLSMLREIRLQLVCVLMAWSVLPWVCCRGVLGQEEGWTLSIVPSVSARPGECSERTCAAAAALRRPRIRARCSAARASR